MDGLRIIGVIAISMILLLTPVKVLADNHATTPLTCQCNHHEAEEGYIIGNGREFKKMNRYEYIIGEGYESIYPLYIDRNGTIAYLEGMLILELRNIDDYDSALAWSVRADEMTTYDDLGITLLRFDDFEKAEDAYKELKGSKDPNIVYMEMALIEEQSW